MGGRKVHFGSGQGRIVGDILGKGNGILGLVRRVDGIVDGSGGGNEVVGVRGRGGIGCSCSSRRGGNEVVGVRGRGGIGCSCSVRVRCGSWCAGRRTEVALGVAGDLHLSYNNC